MKDPFLNGLIIGFFNRARELKIQLIFDEDSYLENFPENIEKSLIISIMGNLLTNAFEEVEKIKSNNESSDSLSWIMARKSSLKSRTLVMV